VDLTYLAALMHVISPGARNVFMVAPNIVKEYAMIADVVKKS